jgi:dTDP-4-amino-4,6-dideoxygalactose transaminase
MIKVVCVFDQAISMVVGKVEFDEGSMRLSELVRYRFKAFKELAMSQRIYLSSPHMGNQELQFVHEAFDTNWVAPIGPNVDGFERDLEVWTDAAKAVALSSGTAAIHLALIILGVGAGDEVLCSSFTFSASANPICYLGATPVFVDSETETWNIDPMALESAIQDRILKGKKPKALILVHLYGMPAKLEEIQAVCTRFEIPIIEDAAEALGSTYRGKALGTFGAIGVLSFNGNKIITTSSGGALISNDPDLVAKAKFLSTQARDPAPHYQHSHVGYNYRMSNITAGIGRGQMLVLSERVAQRRANHDRYWKFFANTPGVSMLAEPKGFFSNRWLSCILVDPALTGGITREDIRLVLERENIESRPLWKPLHMQPIFAESPYYGGSVAESLFDMGLCLPSGSNLSDEEFSRLLEVLERSLVLTHHFAQT